MAKDHKTDQTERHRLESADQAVFAPQFPHRHQRRRPGRRGVAVRGEPRRQRSAGDAGRHAGTDSPDLGQGSRAVGGGLVGFGGAGDRTRAFTWDTTSTSAGRSPRVQKTYTDGLNGQTVFTYHAHLEDLSPDSLHHYSVTADNDSNAAQPFAATFRTAPCGRAPFRFTSFGDLATPVTAWVLSYGQSAFAVQAVEQFQPLFHLLNGDLCYANLNPTVQPTVWADFGNNNQASAANRPWMPCPGNHEIEFYNGEQGFTSYLTRYSLPHNGTRFPGRWYSFQVGTVLFISLQADDVIYQDGGPFVGGPAPLVPAASTGNATDRARHVVLHSWLERRRADALARAHAARGFEGRRHRLDRRADAPGCAVVVEERQRLRPGHPRGLAAAVRQATASTSWSVRSRPRLRAQLPGARLQSRRRPGHRHRRAGRHVPAESGCRRDQRRRQPRHRQGHDSPDPGRRRHQRAARRLRRRCRRRRAAGQALHQAQPPDPQRDDAGRVHARRRRTRWKMRSGRPRATPAPATASRSSTSTPATRAARRRSPSTTTTRPEPTRSRRRTTSCSRPRCCRSTRSAAGAGRSAAPRRRRERSARSPSPAVRRGRGPAVTAHGLREGPCSTTCARCAGAPGRS